MTDAQIRATLREHAAAGRGIHSHNAGVLLAHFSRSAEERKARRDAAVERYRRRVETPPLDPEPCPLGCGRMVTPYLHSGRPEFQCECETEGK